MSPTFTATIDAALFLIQCAASVLAVSARYDGSTRYVRRQSIPADLPGNWSSQGCWTDDVGDRTLQGAQKVDSSNMTVENCISFCDTQFFVFSGVEFGQECYCGNSTASGATNSSLSQCNTACSGDSSESCGAGGRLNLYWSGAQPPPPPIIVPSVGDWKSLGCYSEGTNGRALTTPMAVAGDIDIETCTSACFNGGFPLAGTEFARECYCGATLSNGAEPANNNDCNMLCVGNSSEFCGGPNRLNVYNYTGMNLPSPGTGGGGGGGNGASVSPVLSGLPGNWSYAGCYVDNAHGRVFPTAIPASNNNTIEVCIQACIAQDFTIAGAEFSSECYCGNNLINGATLASQDSDCNMGCAANTTEACGGPSRLSVYSSVGEPVIIPVATPLNTSLPGQWVYKGCLREPGAQRVFPNQLILPNNNTAPNCLSQCSKFGYPAGGMEFGDECYCGDVEDIKANGGVMGDESECTMACSGDPSRLCGGPERIQLYEWNGQLNNWHTPANTGRYEFFVPGVVVPLIATVGINNKVTFLEKFGTSEFDNSTGAYELDLSLASNFSAAWREMHVKSDVFCGGSIVLPDKAARQLNVGGWSFDSTQGVRLYTPDGAPGKNSTNDWEENFQELHLQDQRWYPTAAMLPNGSILVIGGEEGSNGAPTPTLEILPKPDGGRTTIFLDWLDRTDPNNLYPFVFVLPSGNLFVGYYNEARILNPKTFDTITTLPNMPGSVKDPLSGRTYPLEGAAALFPQHAPYTDPVTVLMCGGSGIGANAIGLDNCVSIQPEVKGSNWTIERMPSRRVMACFAPLPDGTILIVNGATMGVAGFGLADDPNLQAILYDPTQPVGSRFSILNETIVARLYHSEATLLPDGRVLISGSDPQDNGKHPEEMRIEVYIPPYLSQGLRQPEFNVTTTDWKYGGTYQISNVQLHQGGTIRISLIAATSSTHGNTMGSRTIFPTFSCSGSTCSITAPPNAFVSPPGWHQLFILDGPTPSHSNWVRIGGDPGSLGNWPDLPGFTLPGV